MEKVLFISAPLKKRIWGGTYFKDVLKVTEDPDNFGEMWSCSGHKEGNSIILSGTFQGMTLSEVYRTHPELFNYPKEKEFPILVKLIATTDDLSVQVHPDDAYALKNEQQLGKLEGWYILDSKEDSAIVVSHTAKDKKELVQCIEKDQYDELLLKRHVKDGDFYPIPCGTIHALGKNLVILEIQQSSDVTYRIYDYHRKDKDGKERDLHLTKALDVITYQSYDALTTNFKNINSALVWKNEYFEVYKDRIKESLIIQDVENYLIVSVIEGNIHVEGKTMQLGDSFIITKAGKGLEISGDGQILITKYSI